MIETAKVRLTNFRSTQLFINIGVLLIKVARVVEVGGGGGGDISVYIHDSLNIKSRRDLDINKKNEVSINRINIVKFKKHRSVNDLEASRW